MPAETAVYTCCFLLCVVLLRAYLGWLLDIQRKALKNFLSKQRE